MLSLRKYTGKQLVSWLRDGDFSHAGGRAAIDLVMKPYNKDSTRHILDLGCGLGGTAHYVQTQGWGKLTGIDIESKSIEYASKAYPEIDFYLTPAEKVNNIFSKNSFDMVYLFNSFYAFSNQSLALQALTHITKPSAELIIFDYSILKPQKETPFYRKSSGAQTSFKPVVMPSIRELLSATGWGHTRSIDITSTYTLWYNRLLKKIKSEESTITEHFGHKLYEKAYETYSTIYNGLVNEELGGVIVYARRDYDCSIAQ